VLKIKILKCRGIDPILGKNDLQLITTVEIQRRPRFWTHTDPVNTRRRWSCSIGFDGYGDACSVKCAHQVIIHLKKRLSSGADDERASVRASLGPLLSNCCGEIFSTLKLAATWPIGSNEISIAEAAYSLGSIPLQTCPEIAPRKPAENRWPARVNAFPLKGVEDLLHDVRHA
jgi:hypothetical protein